MIDEFFFIEMCGSEQLPFAAFEKNMQKKKNHKILIIDCAIFLIRHEKKCKLEPWHDFSNRFFNYYQTFFSTYFHYPPEITDVMKVKVHDKHLLLAVFEGMRRAGVLEAAEVDLAKLLFTCFDMNLKLSSIYQYLCADMGEYEDVISFFESYKKYVISNK